MISILAMSVAMVNSPQAQISPDMALSIAHAIADYDGYTSTQSRKMDYEVTDGPGRQAYPGYVTVQVMSNTHPVFNISVNIQSGQVADFLSCYVFEYPVIEQTESELKFKEQAKFAYSKMMGDNGCDKYTILKHPGDELR